MVVVVVVRNGFSPHTRANFLAHQVWEVSFFVWRWVSDSDQPESLVADEMGLGKTFTLVDAAMICTLQTKNIVMRLLLSILWGNMIEELVNMVQNSFSGIIGEEWEWYLFSRLNSVLCCLFEIKISPPWGASSTYFSPRTDPGGHNPRCGRNIQECH